ncbi:MAG: RidA family protein [Williamsia sp.]|nr:RidA family protein [Williamsia sp.]
MQRVNYASGAHWEEIIGYSRAVKMGNLIEVTGTVAIDENGQVVGKDSVYEQSRYILQKIEKMLGRADAAMKDVIRTRMYITDISRWEELGRAHCEFFKDIKPCTTMVEVSRLISPDYLVEIEATAILHNT